MVSIGELYDDLKDLCNQWFYTKSEIDTALNSKQNNLVSGTNIKTINNNSLLGSGNITIQGGGGGASNIFDLDLSSTYGDTVLEEGSDCDGMGFTLGNNYLIFNTNQQRFFYDKNGNVDYDNGNELATMNDIPSVPSSANIVDLVYPVGSIYMSVNSTSPQTLFGGTWQQLTDTFLYASTTADTNSTTATGGESTHSLTSSEMPSHTHTQNSHYHGCGNGRAFITQKSNYTADVGEKSIKQGTSGNAFTTVAFNSSDNWYGTENTSGATATNQNTGGGQAHNNMPPYMKVYMWKRTA